MFRVTCFSLLLLSVFFTGTVSFAQNKTTAPGDFHIKVKVKGIPKDSTAILCWYYGESKPDLYTAKADASGNFVFSAKEKMLRGMYFIQLAGAKNKYFDFLLSDDQVFEMETDTADFIASTSVKGCEENKSYYDYLRFLAANNKKAGQLKIKQAELEKKNDNAALIDIAHKLEALETAQTRYEERYILKHQATLLAKLLDLQQKNEAPKETATIEQVQRYNRAHYFDGTDWTESGLAHNPWYHKKIGAYLDTYIPQNADSLSAACDFIVEKARSNRELFKLTVQYLAFKYDVQKPTCRDGVLFHMVDTYFKTGQVDWLGQNINDFLVQRCEKMRKHGCGTKAENVFVKDTTGKPHELLGVKAKYTLLVFWDPDCSHCQEEMPELKTEYDELKKYGFEVFAVVPMRETAPWKKFITEHQLGWMNGMGADEKTQAAFVDWYQVYTTPLYYLLDEQKTIIAKNLTPTGMCNEIRKLEGLPLKAEKPAKVH
ncbi:MAG: thiol-disulfide isomerase [Bacteroidetes bacterium]|nr:MAG: thiol-disulfide isomerase [Bacteroidota bacterium]